MGKATSAASTDGFLKLLQQSGLLAGAAWDRAVELSKGAPDLRTAARTLVKENLLTLWQAKQLVSGFADLKFGRYKLLDELGQSEVGRVFLAEHGQLNRRVALKILSRRITADPAAVERFLGEARVLASLNHRNLIHVFDVGQEDRKYYLVFEYAQGRDAQKLVSESGPLSAADSARLIRQAAAGLSAAHERGVSHGDLKPGHFWVDEGGTVKVLDLGIAQLGRKLANSGDVGDDEPTQPSKSSELAPHYLAADQLAGSEATPTGDLYSLGAIWHLLMTGAHPSSASGGEVVSEVARRTLAARRGVPAEVVDMVATLLATKPDERGGSAADWCQRIDAWLATQPTPTRGAAEKRPTTATAAATTIGAKPGPKRPLVRAKSLDDATPSAAPAADRWRSADGGDDEASGGDEGQSSGGGAFIIRTQQGRPRSDKGSKGTGAAASGSPATARLVLLIGGVGGGVLLLFAAVALAWKFWPGDNAASGRSNRQVVKGANSSASSESDLARGFRIANETPATDEPPPNPQNPPIPPPGDPAANPNPNVPANPPPAPNPNPNPNPNPTPDPAAPPMPPPGTTTPPSDPAKPANPAGGAPPAKPEPPVEPKPAEPKPPEPPPADPKPPAAKPAEPKPESPAVAKPETPAAGVEPFRDLPAAVNLPATTADGPSAAPQLLGKIAIAPQALCVVHLLGGGELTKGKQKLALEAGENGTALRDWEIFVREKTAESGGKKVAHLALKNGELTFAWTADSATEPLAPLLANCVLNFASGAKSHALALRTALVGEPLSIELLKSTTGKWEIPAAPDPDKILLEIAVNGPLPPHGFKGDQPVKADKGNLDVQIKFGDRPDEAEFLTLKLETTMKKALQISETAWIKPLFYPKAEKLTVANLKKARQLSASAQATLYGNLEQLKKTGAQDEVTKANMARLEEGNTLALRTGQHLEQLQQLTQAAGPPGVIHVRAYYMADGKRVDLLKTDSAPPSAPAAPAPPQP